MLIVALLSLSLLARLALAYVMTERQTSRLPESAEYLAIGQSVADGNGFRLAADAAPAGRAPGPDRLAARMPGYPLILGAAIRWCELPGRTVAVWQALCGGATLVAALWMAWRLAGPWAALVALALGAFDPFQVYASALLVPVVPVGLAVAAAVAAGLKCVEAAQVRSRQTLVWAAAAGAAIAAAIYLDPWTVAVVPVSAVGALLSRGRRRLLAAWAVAVGVVLVALSPWLVRNAVRLGGPVLTTGFGERLEAAVRSGADTPAASAPPPGGLDELGLEVFYLGRARRLAAESPTACVAAAARRLAAFWAPWSLMPEGGGPLHPLAGYTSLLPPAVLALVGLWRLRRRPAAGWLVLAPLGATVAYAVGLATLRDRLAVMPVLTALAGAGLVAVLGKWPDADRCESQEGT